MSEYTYKMQANILAAQVKQLELSLTTMRKEIDSLWFEWKKLIGALEWIKSQPQECQKIMAKHGWKYEDSEDFEQKMTFTMYSHVVECAAKAEAVLAEAKEKK